MFETFMKPQLHPNCKIHPYKINKHITYTFQYTSIIYKTFKYIQYNIFKYINIIYSKYINENLINFVIENESPSIAGNTSINVEMNKTVYMQFNASDDSTMTPEYRILKYPIGFELNHTTGLATWTPKNTNISEIRYFLVFFFCFCLKNEAISYSLVKYNLDNSNYFYLEENEKLNIGNKTVPVIFRVSFNVSACTCIS